MTTPTQEVKKTLTAVDRSAKALTTAAETVTKVIGELGGITQTAIALAQDIEFKQSELNALDAQYAVKEREQVAELGLRVKENADKVLEALLKERKLVAVAPSVIPELQNELAQAKAATESAVTEAVKIETARLSASLNAQLTAKDSAHKVETAELKATNGALSERNSFLTTQITQLQSEIQKERDARVKIAEAESKQQGVVVNAGK